MRRTSSGRCVLIDSLMWKHTRSHTIPPPPPHTHTPSLTHPRFLTHPPTPLPLPPGARGLSHGGSLFGARQGRAPRVLRPSVAGIVRGWAKGIPIQNPHTNCLNDNALATLLVHTLWNKSFYTPSTPYQLTKCTHLIHTPYQNIHPIRSGMAPTCTVNPPLPSPPPLPPMLARQQQVGVGVGSKSILLALRRLSKDCYGRTRQLFVCWCSTTHASHPILATLWMSYPLSFRMMMSKGWCCIWSTYTILCVCIFPLLFVLYLIIILTSGCILQRCNLLTV